MIANGDSLEQMSVAWVSRLRRVVPVGGSVLKSAFEGMLGK